MWLTLNRENLSVGFVRTIGNVFLVLVPSERCNSYHGLKDGTANQLVTFTTVLLSPSPLQEENVSQDCGQRYHNHSIFNYDPHPSGEFLPFHCALTSLFAVRLISRKYLSSCAALLQMGDYYRDLSSRTGEDSLSLVGQAILMYSRAARAGSPQVTDLLQP